MADQKFNPIQSVDGRTIPCPSAYIWGEADISARDAGRTEARVMNKKRIGSQVRLQLSWAYLNNADVSKVLQAFYPEYINVKYWDARAGGYKTAEFYVSDRSAPMYSHVLGLWTSVSFNIITRNI